MVRRGEEDDRTRDPTRFLQIFVGSFLTTTLGVSPSRLRFWHTMGDFKQILSGTLFHDGVSLVLKNLGVLTMLILKLAPVIFG